MVFNDIKDMDHKDLEVWKKSMELVEVVYELTLEIPTVEKFGLISQMRRSVVSIPSNIAEGCGRKSDKELIQFVHISLGSLAELETQYLIILRLKYIDENIKVEELIDTVKKLLLGFRKYLRNK